MFWAIVFIWSDQYLYLGILMYVVLFQLFLHRNDKKSWGLFFMGCLKRSYEEGMLVWKYSFSKKLLLWSFWKK